MKHRTIPGSRRFFTQPDLTPMADLAFLLLTFFMLVSVLVPPDSIPIKLPIATGYICGPDTDLVTILVTHDKRVFIDIENPAVREAAIGKMSAKYKVSLDSGQVEAFLQAGYVGLNMKEPLKPLDLSTINHPWQMQAGIPIETSNNQLSGWLNAAKEHNPKLRVSIRIDERVSYPIVKQILNILQDNQIYRFLLVHNLERASI